MENSTPSETWLSETWLSQAGYQACFQLCFQAGTRAGFQLPAGFDATHCDAVYSTGIMAKTGGSKDR